jgi:hypothetical protein
VTRVKRTIHRRAWYIPLRHPSNRKRRRWRWGLIVLALATGYLLFAHGCHADKDEELFAPARKMILTR